MNLSAKTKRFDYQAVFKKLLFIIPVGVLGNLCFGYCSTEKEILASVSGIRLEYLFFAMPLGLVPWITLTLRMKTWTDCIGHKFTLAKLFYITIGQELGSAISPTAIGGGYVKLGLLMQWGVPPGKSASLVTLGSVEDAVFFGVSIPTALYTTGAFKLPVIRDFFRLVKSALADMELVSGIIVLIVLLVLLIFKTGLKKHLLNGRFERIFRKLKNFYREFTGVYRAVIQKGKIRFVASLILTSVQWICRYSVITVLLLSFNVEVHPVKFFLFQWIAFTIATFIPTLGGAGGAEASFYVIYSSFIPRDVIGLITVCWRFLTYYMQLCIGSVLFLLFNTGKTLKPERIQSPQ